MRIGIDASRANTVNRTGVEEYVFQVCKYSSTQVLKYPGAEVILYTREPLIPELVSIISDTVQVKVLRWPPKRLWTQIRLSWEMLVHPPDMLFVPGHVFPLIHPKKTVMTVHDVAAKAFPQSYSWFERWYSLWAARNAVKRLWKVIVPSEFTRQELETSNSSLVSVIPLAHDKKYRVIEDKKPIEDVLQKYSIKKPFLLSVGRLETKKNTKRIIQAFNKLKSNHQSPTSPAGRQVSNLQLVLVGGRGHGYQKVLQEIKTSPYKNDIILTGFVSDEDLPYIMNAAEVFVFPSLYEGFGIPILEAFACGTPVVTSNTTSCKEVAGDAAVLVDPFSVESISGGIEEAMKGEKVASAVERAKEYSWEETAKQIIDVLMK